jgi:hypothetical protein
MRTSWSLGAAALAFGHAPAARAAETRADVESDHTDAAADGGPRTAGVLVRASAITWGSLGAEVDVSLGANAALSLEGDWLPFGPARAYAALVGVPLFLQRFAFHGLYVHPRLEWASASASDGSAQGSLKVGQRGGPRWIRMDLAVRRHAASGRRGIAYAKAMGGDSPPSSLTGLHPELDAAVGWIF